MTWKTFTIAIFLAVFVVGFGGAETSFAQTYASYHQPYQGYQYRPMSDQEYLAYLYGIVSQLQLQVQTHEQIIRGGSNYQYQSGRVAGVTYYSSEDEFSYTLRGTVDMRQYGNGLVFFVYGEDRDAVQNVTREDRYSDIDEDGDQLQKILLDRDLDDEESYSRRVSGLDADETYYYRICVEYENYSDNEVLSCGRVITFSEDSDDNDSYDDEPDAVTFSARDIENDEAEIRGEVDMNDFRDGRVFFVYGEDEDEVEDVEDEDTYNDIDERGDDLQKVLVDSNLDDDDSYERTITNLDDDTRYYFRICVEYEDEDDDETLECGDVREFRTDD